MRAATAAAAQAAAASAAAKSEKLQKCGDLNRLPPPVCSRTHHRSGNLVAAAASSSSSSSSSEGNGAAPVLSPSSPAPAFGILYYENFTIRCYEVGTNCRASIQTIANLLQEVACNQVRTLGFSTDGFATTLSMRKHRLIWVITRMHIEMDEYPLWGDSVQVHTWFQESANKNGTRRDWLLKDATSGRTLGRATSSWVMMNQDTRRLARISEEVRSEYVHYALDPPRYAFPEDHPMYQKQSVPKLENATSCVQGLKPRRADLDMNQHVNNVTYIGWMLESLPAGLDSTHELQSITLEFRRECKHEDTVDTLVALHEGALYGNEPGDQNFQHLVTIHGSNTEINRGRTRWRSKKLN